ncbi:MAG: hypothetical protein LVQ96_04085 [Thermoplasmatales archaeon]|nr:hypothetical protein [Thermoplasmatales archaeon]MCW6170333.1 hypothetical protein [Thermoplasmatales archaeon]
MNTRVLSPKGAQIQIVIETQGLMFTPDNLMNVLKSNEFQIVQGVASNPLNPAFPPQNTQIYSKDSLMIYLLQTQPLNSLVFTLMNTVDLNSEKIGGKPSSEMIRYLMDSLSLVDETVSAITFNFTTRFTATRKPIDQLTKLIQTDFFKKLKKDPLLQTLNVLSIRLGDVFPLERQGFNLVIEPLLSNPEKMFFIQFTKKLINRDSLFELVDKFPRTLENLIYGVDSND